MTSYNITIISFELIKSTNLQMTYFGFFLDKG